jgi:anti-sigma B factor antagonist
MEFQAKSRIDEGVTILDLSGALVEGDAEARFRAEISALQKSGTKNVILNLAAVDEIDAAGLGALVYAHASLRMAGGALKLLNPAPRHLRLMILTKLATTFEFFKDEQDAVDSFFPDRDFHHYDVLQFVEEHSQR